MPQCNFFVVSLNVSLNCTYRCDKSSPHGKRNYNNKTQIITTSQWVLGNVTIYAYVYVTFLVWEHFFINNCQVLCNLISIYYELLPLRYCLPFFCVEFIVGNFKNKQWIHFYFHDCTSLYLPTARFTNDRCWSKVKDRKRDGLRYYRTTRTWETFKVLN